MTSSRSRFRLLFRAKHAAWIPIAGAGLLYFGIVHFFGWHAVGIGPLKPSFADLRNITSAVDCQRLGYDPLRENPCDPWGRPMNYPRLWLTIFSALGLGQATTTYLGATLVIAGATSLFALTRRLSLGQGSLFVIFAVSPGPMIAFERGNNDLAIFVLLVAALVIAELKGALRYVSLAIVELCAFLKFFPIFALVGFLPKMVAYRWPLALVTLLPFGVYLFAIQRDLALINFAIPRPTDLSFGSRVLFDDRNLHYLHLERLGLPGAQLSVVLMGVVGCVCLGFAVRTCRAMSGPGTRRSLLGLEVSAVLYVVAFAFGYNWNYRLIFLLLGLPGLMELAADDPVWRRFATALLAAFFVTLWMAPHSNPVLLKQAVYWLLFGLLLYTVLVLRFARVATSR